MTNNNLEQEHKFKVAKDYESEGKILHAIQLYKQILNEDNKNTEVSFSLADIYERIGKLDSAVNLLSELLMEVPDDMEVKLFEGQLYLRNAKWNEAIDVLNSINPADEPIVLFFQGYSHYMLQEYELAKINFMSFISYNEHSELLHEANLYVAKIEIELEDYESALKYAKKCELMYSNFWELNLIFAIIYYNLGMYAHAVFPVEKAVKLNPKADSVYEWSGKIYLKVGEYLKAEKQFRKFVDMNSDVSSDIYTKLAEACLRSSKAEDAIAFYEVALKLDPTNKKAIDGKKSAASLLNKTVSDA